MARGITQEQVNNAADALVQAGERPTVERIRGFLGTGSPNTVTRMLEMWWQRLAIRLQEEKARVTLPDAPATIEELAGQLWCQALIEAKGTFQTQAAEARAALEADRAALQASVEAAKQAEVAAESATMEAQSAKEVAEARLAESARLADLQASQIADLTLQRDTLAQRGNTLENEIAGLRQEMHASSRQIAAERESHAQYVRAVEDRAHTEIDRLRQEVKALKQDAQVSKKAGEVRLSESEGLARRLASELAHMKNSEAVAVARAEVLQAQIDALPKVLQSALRPALRRSEKAPSPRTRKAAKT